MVLSDINMPQMDGLTLLQQIPKVDPNVRCVIVSAYGNMQNIHTAMNRGAFDFVTKPLDFEDLKVTIDHTLRHLAEWREALAARDKLVALQNELELASTMQQSILPTRFPAGAGFRIFGHMEPARAVGGDFFDIMHLDHGRIGLAIADVSDKDVPAALFIGHLRSGDEGGRARRGVARGQRTAQPGQRDLDVRHRAEGGGLTEPYARGGNPGTSAVAAAGEVPPCLGRPPGRRGDRRLRPRAGSHLLSG